MASRIPVQDNAGPGRPNRADRLANGTPLQTTTSDMCLPRTTPAVVRTSGSSPSTPMSFPRPRPIDVGDASFSPQLRVESSRESTAVHRAREEVSNVRLSHSTGQASLPASAGLAGPDDCVRSVGDPELGEHSTPPAGRPQLAPASHRPWCCVRCCWQSPVNGDGSDGCSDQLRDEPGVR